MGYTNFSMMQTKEQNTMNFQYGDCEMEYLTAKDKRLGDAIKRIGYIEREIDPDHFFRDCPIISSVTDLNCGAATIWSRLCSTVGTVSAASLMNLGRERLQQIGITFKKADYILDFAEKVQKGDFDIERVWNMNDADAICELTKLKGIGVWTAEMILTFCMQRADVVSFGDLAILRGMRMLYRHRKIDREKFERYQRRYSPYGTVASLYLWAIAGGVLPELTDPMKKGKH